MDLNRQKQTSHATRKEAVPASSFSQDTPGRATGFIPVVRTAGINPARSSVALRRWAVPTATAVRIS